MSNFYSDMAATASRLLAKFGAPVVLPRETGGSIDPITGEETPGTDDTQTTTGLLKKFPDKLIDGTRIQVGDRVLVLDASVEPLMTDRPTMNGQALGVPQSVETSNPTGTPLVYLVHLRK